MINNYNTTHILIKIFQENAMYLLLLSFSLILGKFKIILMITPRVLATRHELLNVNHLYFTLKCLIRQNAYVASSLVVYLYALL